MESTRTTEIVVHAPTNYLVIVLKRKLVEFQGIDVVSIDYEKEVGRLTVSHPLNSAMLVDAILDMAENLRLLVVSVGPKKVELRYLAYEGGPGWGNPKYMLD